MKVNAFQLDVLTKHITTKSDIKAALHYHIIDGLTMYAAEKKAGIPFNSLRNKVVRIKKELNYINEFNKVSEKKEYQYTLV
ncbi:TPA: hypothetical protein ACX6RX_003168 [Photobacterium damselae]